MRYSLNEVWKFFPDIGEEGEAFRFWEPTFCDRRWGEAAIPSCWEAIHEGLSGYEGSVWFRRQFRLPAEWPSLGSVWVRFEGVNDRARVWLNGHWLGAFSDPFLPFFFDATPFLMREGENLLTVEISNKPRPEDVPGTHVGWRRQGGITREVMLEWRPPLFATSLDIEPDAQTGLCRLSGSIRYSGPGEKGEGGLSVAVFGPDGSLVFESAPIVIEASARSDTAWAVQGRIPHPAPWSPSSPALYRVRCRITGRDGLTDMVEKRFGFRTITAAPDGLRLNGERIFLTGFNRHEDGPWGEFVFDAVGVRKDLEQMKAAGANFVRLAHYPHHPGELDLCDELGLAVLAEIPLYFWNDRDRGRAHQVAREAAGKRQLEAMIARDRHHPSILFWSVSNETDEDEPEPAAMNRRLIQAARALDPTRLCVHVSNHWVDHPQFDEDDVIAINGYPSLKWETLGRGPNVEGEKAAAEWRRELDRLHARYPAKPILITEFGGCSWEGVYGGAFGEDRHARQLAIEWSAFDRPYLAGVAVWCWADHLWPPGRFFGGLAVSPFGVMTRDRRPKAAFAVIRRLFLARQGRAEEESVVRKPNTNVIMIRPHLEAIPEAPFPEGFGLRPMTREDVGLWTDIWRDAEPFLSISDDLFQREFGEDWPAIGRRCFLVTDPRGCGVGTISAWRNRDFRGEDFGRIHWVAIRPAFQRRGLARAALAAALRVLAQWHRKAYLVTQTERLGAIRLYLDFGFEPDLTTEEDRARWTSVQTRLSHPRLEAALQPQAADAG